jgi:simple sugar transport system permease protein
MAVAGALAGVAGALVVLGTEGKYPAALPAPYGFDGIAIAMVGQAHPLGVALAALFFGALRAGGARMQLHGIHPSFPEVLQGLALLFAALPTTWVALRRVRRPVSSPGSEPARA